MEYAALSPRVQAYILVVYLSFGEEDEGWLDHYLPTHPNPPGPVGWACRTLDYKAAIDSLIPMPPHPRSKLKELAYIVVGE